MIPIPGIQLMFGGLASPLIAAWEPIHELLDPENDQDDLTRKWHESKLEELRFVGLTVRYLGLKSLPGLTMFPECFSRKPLRQRIQLASG